MSMNFEKIAIVGAGAVGSFYGANLARVGRDAALLLRSELEAVRKNGIVVRERKDEWHVGPERIRACGSAEEIGPVDLVLITLKTTGNEALRDMLPPLLRANTVVATLQNGLGNEEFVAGIVGERRVVGGICFIAVVRGGAGELVGFSTPGTLTLGEFRGAAVERTRAIAELMSGAGIPSRAVDDLGEARWRKLIWNIPFNGVSIAAGGVTTDVICGSEKLTAEVRGLMDEVVAAAAAFGYVIPQEFCEQQYLVTTKMGAYKPSSLVDCLAGRAVEVEAIWGEALRRAQAAGVKVPRLEKLYGELLRVAKRE